MCYGYKKPKGKIKMELNKEEIEILRKIRDARITKDVLLKLTQIAKDIISKRKT